MRRKYPTTQKLKRKDMVGHLRRPNNHLSCHNSWGIHIHIIQYNQTLGRKPDLVTDALDVGRRFPVEWRVTVMKDPNLGSARLLHISTWNSDLKRRASDSH